MSKVFVCRCEDVTVSDLEECLARGFHDLESIKRYTGFGTGFCQGKHCLGTCARILAEHGHEVSEPFRARPPYHPVSFGALAELAPLIDEDEAKGRAPH